MGVKDLWGIISPTSELIKLQDINEKIIAIDLSCWICDSQNANMGATVVKPHLRNLFFRTVSMVKAGILPIFVLEGDAPIIKLTTIQNRITKHSKCPTKVSGAGTSRARLKGLLKQCRELLTLMGLPCVQAEGEAEATCAALSYHQLVDGVITQDSDVFLYGANVVFRNFSGNKQKATVEKYKSTIIKEKLGLNRDSLICLAVLLGCDYLPAGIPGVGKENALKLIRYWESSDILHPLQRLLEWKLECNPKDQKSIFKGKVRNSERTIEDIVKEKALRTPGFPFPSVIEEFCMQLNKPRVKIKWTQPDMANLVLWCIKMLGWEAKYAMEKVMPFATFWIIANSLSTVTYYLKPLKINRKCVLQGVNSYEVTWQVSKCKILPDGLPTEYNIIEPSHLMNEKFYPLVQEFEDVLSMKRGKKVKGKKKSNNVVDGSKEEHKSLKENDKLKKIQSQNCVSDCSLSDESVNESELSSLINNLGSIKINGKESNSKNEVRLVTTVDDNSTVRQDADLANAWTKLNSTDKFNANKINSKIKNLVLSPRQTTLDKFCSNDKICKKSRPTSPLSSKLIYCLKVSKPGEGTDISVINISSELEESVIYDTATEGNIASAGDLCASSCSNLNCKDHSEDPDERNLPNLELTWQDDDNSSKDILRPINCEFKIDVKSENLSRVPPENVSKDLFEDSESLIEVSEGVSNFSSQPFRKITYNETSSKQAISSCVDGHSLPPKLCNENEKPSTGKDYDSVLCFQLLDSISDLTFTPISTPLNASKINGPFNSTNRSAHVTAADSFDFSNISVFKKEKLVLPINSTPKMGGKTALPFDTPRGDGLSLAERLRGRYGAVMDDVLDDM